MNERTNDERTNKQMDFMGMRIQEMKNDLEVLDML